MHYVYNFYLQWHRQHELLKTNEILKVLRINLSSTKKFRKTLYYGPDCAKVVLDLYKHFFFF